MSVSPGDCPAITVLEDVAVGRPPPPDVEAHLRTCRSCRRALRRIREDNQFLSGFAQGGVLPDCPAPEPTPPIEIPGYRIEREIHQGGQGVVYQAVQLSTRRAVAIKVMKQGPFATTADRTRFDREVETLGRLNHPNIVAVHDAGMVSGFQYFVMNYVDGQPLDEAVLGQRQAARGDEPAPDAPASRDLPGSASPAQTAETLRLFIKICDAVHAAHLRGVMHRDLKPSNIRVDRNGEPHVLDFGLAKPVDSSGEWSMTRTGQFVGSLPWASPEQVEGASSKIDLRTDVYSLGAILFQLLTGVLPFDVGSNLRSAVDKILFREPPRPSTLALGINDELDTIILKCLSKERERRYQGAGELARDLRHYLAGEAIEAKRDSAVYMLRKTLRRYRLRVAVAAAFLVLLVAFAGVMAVLYRRSTHLEQDAVRSAASLTDSLSRSNIEQGRMAGMLGNIQQGEQLLWRELLTRHGVAQGAALQVNDPPGPPEAYWALWELYRRYPCVRTLAPAQTASCTTTASDDGKTLWTADADGHIEQLDEFGRVLDSYNIPFVDARGWPTTNSRGQLVLNREGDHIAVWRRGGGDQPALSLPPGTGSFPDGVTWSKSGRWVAAVIAGAAVVWSVDPPAEVARFAEPHTDLTALALSNDDTRLAARDQTGHLFIWDIQSQRPLLAIPIAAPPREALRGFGGLLFSPNDHLLADAWIESPGRIWNLDRNPPAATELQDRPGDHRVLAFSQDSRSLAIGDLGGALRIFDTTTGERRVTFVATQGRVRGIAFVADGKSIWTFGDDGFRLWDVNPDAGIRILHVEHEAFHGVDIARDGNTLLAGGGLGKLYHVDRATLTSTDQPLANPATISCVAISSDGRYVAASTYANETLVWDEQHRERPPIVLPHANCVSFVCFSPDGTRLATACDDRVARLWRCSDGQLQAELRGAEDRIPQVAFDPSGRLLAAAVRSGALHVWDVDTREGQIWSPPTQKPLRAVQFSPDGRWLYAAGAERVIAIWDAQSGDAHGRPDNRPGQRVAALVGHNQEIYCMDISSNGELIASGDSGGTIRLWHAGLRRPLATLDGHTDAVMALRFTRDGRALVSASLDGTVRVWDLTYYARHIAGNVAVQLKHTGADQADAERAESWTRWADSVPKP